MEDKSEQSIERSHDDDPNVGQVFSPYPDPADTGSTHTNSPAMAAYKT
jgi:hypothetical protein